MSWKMSAIWVTRARKPHTGRGGKNNTMRVKRGKRENLLGSSFCASSMEAAFSYLSHLLFRTIL